MKMKLWASLLMLALSVGASAQSQVEITDSSQKALLSKATLHFSQGKYETTAEELERVETSVTAKPNPDGKLLGLLAYWKGIAYSRLQEYQSSTKNFRKALELKYAPVDIHYEYGQALYASENLKEARLQFRESLRRKFKPGVSLYYIAYLTKELGEKNKALEFFRKIEKLDRTETKDIRQAVEFQIGDIYLEQTEKHKDAFRAVEKFVIPQYEKAFDEDPASSLAPQIKEKIIALQRKYDLVLFNLRNGRPTLIPAHFLRAAQEIGLDTNVTFSPNETTVSKSRQASVFSKSEFIGRYTYYVGDFMSIAPEFRFSNTYYFHRVKEIYRNDNQLYAPAVRTSFEHTLWKKPAATLFDYDFNQAHRDVDAKKRLDFSSRSHTFMLGERFNYFTGGETILRVRHRTFDSYLESQNSQTWSAVVEQFQSVGTSTLLFYLSLDRARVADEAFDTSAMTFRTDYIMSQFRDWFSPSAGLSLTRTDPVNSRSTRGQETLVNPNLRLYRAFGRFRGALKYDYMRNYSKDETSFAYKKQTYAVEVEYLF